MEKNYNGSCRAQFPSWLLCTCFIVLLNALKCISASFFIQNTFFSKQICAINKVGPFYAQKKNSEISQENSIQSSNHRPYNNTYAKERTPSFPRFQNRFLTLKKQKSKILTFIIKFPIQSYSLSPDLVVCS